MRKIFLSFIAILMALLLVSCSFLKSVKTGSESDQKLYMAIEQNNLEAINEALTAGANVNQFTGVNGIRTEDGIWEKNPLRIALYSASPKIPELLIEKKANVNYEDASGISLLMYTSYHLKMDFTELLLQHYANVNLRGANGETALDYCLTNTGGSEYDLKPIVELLLDNEADISAHTVLNVLKPNGETYYDRYGITKLLIQKAGVQDFSENLSPELAAAVNNDAETVKTYIDSISMQDMEDYRQILFYSAAWDNLDVIKTYIGNGGNKELSDAYGNTLLIIAARYGSQSVLQWLFENGADINAQNSESQTALVAATLYGQHDAAAYLIGKKAQLSTAAPYGMKYNVTNDVMINAAGNGDVELMKDLLDSGYKMDDWHIFEAMFHAVQHDQKNAVDYLLDKGYPIDLENDKETILSLACVKSKSNMVDYLISRGANADGASIKGLPLRCAAEVGDAGIIHTLIQNGANVNAIANADGGDDESALMKAISCGSLDCVKLLVDNGADLEYTTSKGSRETALLMSVSCGSVNITSYLLTYGADANTKDADGFTAYDRAVNMNDRGMKSLLRSKQ